MAAIEKIKEFLRSDICSGYGYGSGYGSGDGAGDGSGYSSGTGYGSGYGYGASYGSGNGAGDGAGSGYGTGYGYSDGAGYGTGYGIQTFNGNRVYQIDGIDTIINQIKRNVAKGYILNLDFSLSKCYVIKANGLFAHGESLGQAQAALEEKLFDSLDDDERISLFVEHFELNRKYPAKEFYVWHNKLTGSCEMGRKTFANDHGIDIENDSMTAKDFITLTKDSYGGSIIKKLGKEIGAL